MAAPAILRIFVQKKNIDANGAESKISISQTLEEGCVGGSTGSGRVFFLGGGLDPSLKQTPEASSTGRWVLSQKLP